MIAPDARPAADDRDDLDALADARLDGELSDAAWATLLAHHGDALTAALDRCRRVRTALATLPRPALPDHLRTRLLAQTSAPAPLAPAAALAPTVPVTAPPLRPVGGWRSWLPLTLAAGVAVAIALPFVIDGRIPGREPPSTRSGAPVGAPAVGDVVSAAKEAPPVRARSRLELEGAIDGRPDAVVAAAPPAAVLAKRTQEPLPGGAVVPSEPFAAAAPPQATKAADRPPSPTSAPVATALTTVPAPVPVPPPAQVQRPTKPAADAASAPPSPASPLPRPTSPMSPPVVQSAAAIPEPALADLAREAAAYRGRAGGVPAPAVSTVAGPVALGIAFASAPAARRTALRAAGGAAGDDAKAAASAPRVLAPGLSTAPTAASAAPLAGLPSAPPPVAARSAPATPSAAPKPAGDAAPAEAAVPPDPLILTVTLRNRTVAEQVLPPGSLRLVGLGADGSQRWATVLRAADTVRVPPGGDLVLRETVAAPPGDAVRLLVSLAGERSNVLDLP